MRLIAVLSLLGSVYSAGAAALPVKIATWNLNWLTTRSQASADLPADVQPRDPADFPPLQAYARHLAADIIAFEEVDGAATAARIFDPGTYALLTIDEPVVQQVGLAVRRGIGVSRNPDVTTLDVERFAKHRLRNGLDVTLTFAGGHTLRLLALHLKTGCHTDRLPSGRPQCVLLAQQIPPLAAWIAARQVEGVPFAILGDFNRVLDWPEAMGEALSNAAPLLRVTEGQSDPCWEGGAFIDHIFLGGPARFWLVPGSLRVLTYRETDPAEKEHLSDHCPVSARLDIP